jgi:hypothetical protein
VIVLGERRPCARGLQDMDDFQYFVDNFIIKNKKSRWMHFLKENRWDKIADQLHKLDKDLNDKCCLYEKNGLAAFNGIMNKESDRHGVYIDKDGIIQKDYLPEQEIHDDSIFVCRNRRIAFYFSHEGWVWVCRQ